MFRGTFTALVTPFRNGAIDVSAYEKLIETQIAAGISGVVAEWTLGPDPMAPNFGARSLAADPGPAGPGGLPSVDAHSSYWDQRNVARLPRLETHSRSRGNVQTIPKSSLPIKRQSRVGLGEMIMTAHLDRPVTRVGDCQRDGDSILVQDDLARCWKDFARYHVSPRSKLLRPKLQVHP